MPDRHHGLQAGCAGQQGRAQSPLGFTLPQRGRVHCDVLIGALEESPSQLQRGVQRFRLARMQEVRDGIAQLQCGGAEGVHSSRGGQSIGQVVQNTQVPVQLFAN